MKRLCFTLAILSFALALSPALFPEKHNRVSFRKEKLKHVRSYANSYIEYTRKDLETLKKFDIVVIDPVNGDRDFVRSLKKAGTVVLAYIDIGEVEVVRDYYKDLRKSHPELMLAPNPDWEGCFFADVLNPLWHEIILKKHIPPILREGDYDGLCMDMLDTVDMYRKKDLRPGMIQLVKKIRDAHPNLILVPNRGFTVLPKIMPWIDAFKYEEMSSRYDFEKKKYVLEDDEEEQKLLFELLKKHPMPVLVLDHVQTNPPDYDMARSGYEKARKFERKTGIPFIWYANSVNQDLPLWNFSSRTSP